MNDSREHHTGPAGGREGATAGEAELFAVRTGPSLRYRRATSMRRAIRRLVSVAAALIAAATPALHPAPTDSDPALAPTLLAGGAD